MGNFAANFGANWSAFSVLPVKPGQICNFGNVKAQNTCVFGDAKG